MDNLPNCEPIAKLDEITESEWLQLRKGGIGGSDAGAVMGMNKYNSPLSVWMDKTGRMNSSAEGEAIDVGNELESFLREEMLPKYLDKFYHGLDYKVYPPEYMYRSTLHPFIIVNPDGFIEIDGELCGLEIKTGSSYVMKEWGGKDGDLVPDSYYCQVQHYLAGTGLSNWIIFALIGNQRVYRIVPKSEYFINELVKRETQLWELIKLNDPLYAPMPIGTDADDEAIKLLNNPAYDATADLNDIDYLIKAYIDVKEELKDKQEEKKRLQQSIQLHLGKCTMGETEDYRVRRIQFIKKSFQEKQFKTDHPDIYSQYLSDVEIDYPRISGRKK